MTEQQSQSNSPNSKRQTRWEKLVEIWRTTYDDEWWNIVFARPMALFAVYPIADLPFITPNLITAFDCALMLIFLGLLILGTPTAYLVAAVLILVIDVVDAMDGHLARYRGTSSSFGAYFDKVADHFLWNATFAILGYKQWQVTGDWIFLGLGFATGISITMRAYIWWIWRSQAAKVPEATLHTFIVKFQSKDQNQPSNPKPKPLMPWNLKTHLQIFMFSEGDLYFWLALLLALNRIDLLLWIVGTTQVLNTLVRLIQRGYNMFLLDEYRQKKEAV